MNPHYLVFLVCSLQYGYFTAKIHLWVSSYPVWHSQSGYLTQEDFISTSVHLLSNILVSLFLTDESYSLLYICYLILNGQTWKPTYNIIIEIEEIIFRNVYIAYVCECVSVCVCIYACMDGYACKYSQINCNTAKYLDTSCLKQFS